MTAQSKKVALVAASHSSHAPLPAGACFETRILPEKYSFAISREKRGF